MEKNELNELEFIESFFTTDSIGNSEKFYRVKKGDNRYYIDSNFNIKIGVTSFLAKILPENYYLELWKKEVGEKNAQQIFSDRARYGTLFHTILAQILKTSVTTKTYNVPLLFKEIKDIVMSFGLAYELPDLYELQYDLASFASFCENYKPIPYLIETPLKSNVTDIACTLDFAGSIEIKTKGFYGEVYKSGANKGEKKETYQSQRIDCIIDYKTMIKKEGSEGMSKAIGTSNKFQLNFQRMILTENYPTYLNYKMFNAIPKNWLSNPEMQLTEIEFIDNSHLINLFKLAEHINPYLIHKVADSKMIEFSNYNSNITDSIKQITFKDYCKNLII